MPTYRLASDSMICAPGILAWCINGYKFKRGRPQFLGFMRSGWGDRPEGPPDEVFDRLLKGEIEYSVEDSEHGGTVVFSVPDAE